MRDSPVPDVVGRYRVSRKIAAGLATDVLLAKSDGADGPVRDVVLEILLERYAKDERFASAYRTAATEYARLVHPAIAQLYESFQFEDRPVIAVEYVDGGDLAHVRGMFKAVGADVDDTAALHMGAEIFTALAVAHNARDQGGSLWPVVHRYISPSSVLLSWDGAVKLRDFGMPQPLSDVRDAGIAKGADGYMAPEQVTGESQTPASDVYAAAVLVWELLTKKRAFRRSKRKLEMWRAMSEPKFEPLDVLRRDLDVTVREGLRTALHPRIEKRTISAQDLADTLRRSVSAEEGRARVAALMASVRHEPRPLLSDLPPPMPLTSPATPITSPPMPIASPPTAAAGSPARPPLPRPAPKQPLPRPAPKAPPPAPVDVYADISEELTVPVRPPPQILAITPIRPSQTPSVDGSAPLDLDPVFQTVPATEHAPVLELASVIEPAPVLEPDPILDAAAPPSPPVQPAPEVFHVPQEARLVETVPPRGEPTPPPTTTPRAVLAGVFVLAALVGGTLVGRLMRAPPKTPSSASATAKSSTSNVSVRSPGPGRSTDTSTGPAGTLSTSTPTPTPTSTSTPTAAAPAASASVAASAASSSEAAGTTEIPEGMGMLETTDLVGGRRIFVDDRVVAETPKSVLVKCGQRNVQIGSAGKKRVIDVPCGASIAVTEH